MWTRSWSRIKLKSCIWSIEMQAIETTTLKYWFPLQFVSYNFKLFVSKMHSWWLIHVISSIQCWDFLYLAVFVVLEMTILFASLVVTKLKHKTYIFMTLVLKIKQINKTINEWRQSQFNSFKIMIWQAVHAVFRDILCRDSQRISKIGAMRKKSLDCMTKIPKNWIYQRILGTKGIPAVSFVYTMRRNRQ